MCGEIARAKMLAVTTANIKMDVNYFYPATAQKITQVSAEHVRLAAAEIF